MTKYIIIMNDFLFQETVASESAHIHEVVQSFEWLQHPFKTTTKENVKII